MKLYYSPGACSLAAHVVLEEIGVPYELEAVPVADGANLRPGYEAVNALRRVPVLEVNGERLTEVGAILGYLAELRPDARLLPEDPWLRGRAREWASFLASSVHIDFAQVWRTARFTHDQAGRDSVSRRGMDNLREHMDILESRLPGAPYALGERYSIVDPYLLVFHRWLRRVGLDARAYPRFTAVVRSTLARPATRRALEAEKIDHAVT